MSHVYIVIGSLGANNVVMKGSSRRWRASLNFNLRRAMIRSCLIPCKVAKHDTVHITLDGLYREKTKHYKGIWLG